MANFTGNSTNNPFWNLPITDPRCMNASCDAFIIGWNNDQARYSNHQYLHYGFWTVYIWLGLIALFTFLHLRHRITDLNSQRRISDRLQAMWRFFTYRRLDGKLGEQLDLSYGILVLLAGCTVFLAVMPFYQGYYLRSEFRYGSPPLSVRCAVLMSALTPVMIVLAGKMNLVTLLTGVSYAKLNLWHRFVGYAVFVLAWIHTIPHLIAPIKEGGLQELTHLFAIERREFSGTFLLFDFVCLVVFSFPYFRNRWYEVFKQGHIIFALGWFGLIFWHIRNEYVAPEFFYSATGVWACSVVARIIYRNRFMFPLTNITRGFPTTLEHLPGNMTRVAIAVPAGMRWKPGQHCYISIPGISSTGNHPFTIASIPDQKSHLPKYYQGTNEVILLIRECGGFTKALGAHAKSLSQLDLRMGSLTPTPTTPGMALQKLNSSTQSLSTPEALPDSNLLSPHKPSFATTRENRSGSLTPTAPPSIILPDRDSRSPSAYSNGHNGRKPSISPSLLSLENTLEAQHESQVSAWVDGPFGEYTRPFHRHYEGFITIAGGSGLTASLPWMVYLTEKMNRAAKPGDYECSMRSVTFIWSIRKAEWIVWARRELIRSLRAAAQSEGRFQAIIYVTSRDADEAMAKAMQLDLMIAAGLSEGIERSTLEVRYGRPEMDKLLVEVMDRGRNMVRVCGPNALKSGVSNTVANMQKLVIQKRIESISLDSETFGW